MRLWEARSRPAAPCGWHGAAGPRVSCTSLRFEEYLIATTILPPPVVPQVPSRRPVAAVIETDRRTSGAPLTAGLDVAGLAALVFAGALLAALGALLHERRDVTG